MYTPSLIETVTQGNLAKALDLLSSGADPNEKDPNYGWTSLHIAAREGKIGLARILLRFGSEVDARDSIGQTPLHRACFWGQKEMVQILLHAHADFSAMDHVLQSPLDLAKMHGHAEIEELLIESYMKLELGTLEGFSDEATERMKQQIISKQETEARRKKFKKQIQSRDERLYRLKEKLFAKEEKLNAKQVAILEKMEALKDELNSFSNMELGQPSKKEKSSYKLLQSKFQKLHAQLEEIKGKIESDHQEALRKSKLVNQSLPAFENLPL